MPEFESDPSATEKASSGEEEFSRGNADTLINLSREELVARLQGEQNARIAAERSRDEAEYHRVRLATDMEILQGQNNELRAENSALQRGYDELEDEATKALYRSSSETFQEKQKREKLEEKYFKDGLTKAIRREVFLKLVEDEIERIRETERETQEPVLSCLIAIDIDDFKQYNTLYQYEGGDAVLAQVARVIDSVTKDQDIVGRMTPEKEARTESETVVDDDEGDLEGKETAEGNDTERTEGNNDIDEIEQKSLGRIGGDEFCVLATNLKSSQNAYTIAERIRKALEEADIKVNGERVDVTTSVGVGLIHTEIDNEFADPFSRVGEALLLEAKTSGKNTVAIAQIDKGDIENPKDTKLDG